MTDQGSTPQAPTLRDQIYEIVHRYGSEWFAYAMDIGPQVKTNATDEIMALVTGTGQPALTEEERGLLEGQAHDWQWDGERNATGDQQAIYLAQASGLRKLLALSRTAATPTDAPRIEALLEENARLAQENETVRRCYSGLRAFVVDVTRDPLNSKYLLAQELLANGVYKAEKAESQLSSGATAQHFVGEAIGWIAGLNDFLCKAQFSEPDQTRVASNLITYGQHLIRKMAGAIGDTPSSAKVDER